MEEIGSGVLKLVSERRRDEQKDGQDKEDYYKSDDIPRFDYHWYTDSVNDTRRYNIC